MRAGAVERVETYRELAEQCRAQAKTAPTVELRALNLELAKYWDDIATEREQKLIHRKEQQA
jgi:hypothetical protein